MEWHAALAIPLGARDFDAVQAAGAHDLDALCTQAHGIGHRTLHRTAEHDALFQLRGDVVRDQLRIKLGLAYFFDVDVYRHAHQPLQLAAQRFDVFTLLADHHAGTRAVDRDAGVLRGTLDHDTAHRRVTQALLEKVAHLDVFVEHRRKVARVRVPAGAPVLQHRKAEADRIDLLTHTLFLLVADRDEDMARRLHDLGRPPLGARAEAAQKRAALHEDTPDLELIDVGGIVVLGVGNRRLEHLADDACSLLRAEGEYVQRPVDGQSADLVRNQPALLSRQADAAQRSCGFHGRVLFLGGR